MSESHGNGEGRASHGMVWERIHPHADVENHLGFIPGFLSVNDERSARDQIDTAYAHGGGWNSFKGFRLDPETFVLKYPGDPPTLPLFKTKLRDETVVVYQYAWVAVIQSDGSFEVSRVD